MALPDEPGDEFAVGGGHGAHVQCEVVFEACALFALKVATHTLRKSLHVGH